LDSGAPQLLSQGTAAAAYAGIELRHAKAERAKLSEPKGLTTAYTVPTYGTGNRSVLVLSFYHRPISM